MPQARPRDTDADWRHLGETDPYFGVVTDPRFRSAAMDEAALEDFYESGRRDVDGIVALIERTAGPPQGRTLDVGCGVGRLAEAMADRGFVVTGYDISPGMLDKARARSGGRVTYVDALPDGPFDWINSYIVLQHVPPERGLELIGRMAERLALNGVLSLHLPFGEDPSGDEGPSFEERIAQAPLGPHRHVRLRPERGFRSAVGPGPAALQSRAGAARGAPRLLHRRPADLASVTARDGAHFPPRALRVGMGGSSLRFRVQA